MATYFIGVDYGTIHTKACVRADTDFETTPVVVNEKDTGSGQYLWPSAGSEWSDQESPKVLLCRAHDIQHAREHQALQVAANAVAHCVRCAISQIDGAGDEIIVQLGLPTQEGITDERAAMRYELIANQAIDGIDDRRLKPGKPLLDERLAALALLNRARFEFNNEPLMVVDGGGWTTHASFLRWVREPETRVSVHGSDTVMHGVQDVVRQIARSLRVGETDAERALHDVVVAAYSACRNPQGLDLRFVISDDKEVAAICSRKWGMNIEEGQRRVQYVLCELASYVEHRRLEEVWDTAWRGGWTASPGSKHYTSYRLLLLGGASRIGRTTSIGTNDPIARRIQGLQEMRTISFTDIVYPEMNRQFWTVFKPQPAPEAVPYLFVAGGYTLPLADWPEQLKREVIALERPRARAAYDLPESEPG